jgi:hypothetical protein
VDNILGKYFSLLDFVADKVIMQSSIIIFSFLKEKKITLLFLSAAGDSKIKSVRDNVLN